MAKKSKQVPQISIVNLRDFTNEELELIALLKDVTGEKTAAGMFKYILRTYYAKCQALDDAIQYKSKFEDLKAAIKEIQELVK